MATYAVGDVQGCYDTLQALLERIRFDPGADRLWLVGDLVNRGPRSAQVLRFVRALGARATAVLGNHDLHLLARAEGLAPTKKLDTVEDVLSAPDRDELVQFVQGLPFLHREGPYVLVHAGLHPSWDAGRAEALAREAESALASAPTRFLANVRERRDYDDELVSTKRAAAAAAVLTRVRTVRQDGRLCSFSGHPKEAPGGCRPWFERRPPDEDVCFVFGHWSTLGLYLGRQAIGIDTGCVWGAKLTAVRLEDREVYQQDRVD